MTNPFLTDPLLMAFDTLPAHKLLKAGQVALLIEQSTRWLEEQRSKRNPPPWVRVGERAVAYAVGPLRAWLHALMTAAPTSPHAVTNAKADDIVGLDEPILPGGKRKTPKQAIYRLSHDWPGVG